jgi:hypothetical protein
MRRICGIALVFIIFVVAATAAPAPEARPLGGLAIAAMIYLRDVKFRKELQLSEDQVKKIEGLQAKQRQAFAELRSVSKDGLSKEDAKKKLEELRTSNESALEKILTRKQIKRAEEIYLQHLDLMIALRKSQVAAALKLTDEQNGRIAIISKEFLEALRTRRTQEQAAQRPLKDLTKDRDEKLLELLTDAQKTKWKQITGKPFKLERRLPREKGQSNQGSDNSAVAK